MILRDPLTFEEFVACSRHRRLEYIREERARMVEASRLWFEHRRMMAERLNMHPLTLQEIREREARLRDMERKAQEDDTEALRVSYDFHLAGFVQQA
jgi:hypothetical protein